MLQIARYSLNSPGFQRWKEVLPSQEDNGASHPHLYQTTIKSDLELVSMDSVAPRDANLPHPSASREDNLETLLRSKLQGIAKFAIPGTQPIVNELLLRWNGWHSVHIWEFVRHPHTAAPLHFLPQIVSFLLQFCNSGLQPVELRCDTRNCARLLLSFALQFATRLPT